MDWRCKCQFPVLTPLICCRTSVIICIYCRMIRNSGLSLFYSSNWCIFACILSDCISCIIFSWAWCTSPDPWHASLRISAAAVNLSTTSECCSKKVSCYKLCNAYSVIMCASIHLRTCFASSICLTVACSLFIAVQSLTQNCSLLFFQRSLWALSPCLFRSLI